jgi:hypothetical protein
MFFDVTRVIKLGGVRLAGQTVFMGEMRNVYKILVRNS